MKRILKVENITNSMNKKIDQDYFTIKLVDSDFTTKNFLRGRRQRGLEFTVNHESKRKKVKSIAYSKTISKDVSQGDFYLYLVGNFSDFFNFHPLKLLLFVVSKNFSYPNLILQCNFFGTPG